MKSNFFTGGGLAYGMRLTSNGVTACSLKDLKTKKALFCGERPLFYLTARNIETGEELTVSSECGWGFADINKFGVTLSGNDLLPDVTVNITITGGEKFLTFNTSLVNGNDTLSLYKCDYPALYFDKNKDTRFFYPYGPGETKNSVDIGDWKCEQSYPSYGASMQYLAFYNEKTKRGVYYGCHDVSPASKKLCTEGKASDGVFTLKAWQLLSGITSGRNSQNTAGSICMCAFDGDWYDASVIYREFTETLAEYNSDYDENGRKNVPDWLRETDCWFNTRVLGDDEDFADYVIEQAKKIGVAPAVHLYYWHKIPFDNDYPHYFPMKPNVLDGLKKLHDAGIKVMPYINGRLWDTRDKGMEDFEFTSVAKPNCTKDLSGEPITETYSSTEEDGSKVVLSVMCPSTTLWQDKVASIVKQLEDYGFDGVYIDQIAAAEAKPCTDKNHKHPAGGGEWWCRAYNTMLERINRNKGAGFALTTECTADPFMKHLDGYLTWIWIKNDQVPAFPTVYSDKVIAFGTDFRGLGNMDYGLFGVLDEAGVRIFAAQSFLYGQQMGWMTPELFARMPHQDFYIHLVRERARFRDYFLCGKVLRPPVIKDNGKNIVLTKCREAYNGYVESQCVNGMLWEKKTDKKKVLLLTNSGETAVTAKITTVLPDGEYNVCGDKKTAVTVKNGRFTLKMPALSLCYIEA